MRFIAMDFETASQRPDSACQIGIAVVENGVIAHEYVTLIRPPSLYFSPRCIAVHGIYPHQVKDAPTWDCVWEELQAKFDGHPVIAHNAAFDMNVLCAAFSAYGLEIPYLEYHCTRMIGRRTWPDQPSHALKSLADLLDLRFRHHDALEDAKVCAFIALAAAERCGANTIEELEQRLHIDRGRVQFGVRIPPKAKSLRQAKRKLNSGISPASSSDSMAADDASGQESHSGLDGPRLQSGAGATDSAFVASQVARSIAAQCQHQKPLAGKYIVLSGRLLGLDRSTAVAFLEQLGANVQTNINMQTNCVLQGTAEANSTEIAGDDLSQLSQRQQAEIDRRVADGQPIRQLSQRQLLALLPGGAAAVRAGLQVQGSP